ncbi:MAG: NAD(P)H-quinone oxidoreductase [Alphaproteobacteria bacterium]|nr:NAD(P)H-quinone oxidoreductase [Alphaproteobacteria bacterium]
MNTIPAKMKAAVAGKIDGRPAPVITEIDVPQPGPEDVLIKVAATGLNRGDLMQVAGFYPPPPGAPQTLGLEASGTVVATGAHVTRHKVGDVVCGLVAGGGYAEFCVVHEDSALPVPKGVSAVDAAALPEAHFTVWTNVVDRARLKAGETLLVHGGSSGIGTAAIQVFAARGHRVFTTAGSADKCAACERLGAARAVNYREADFEEVIRAETGGAGVDVILDMVGGDYIGKNFNLLKLEGRLVNIAFQNGAQATLNLLPMMLKRLTITGSTLRARSHAEKGEIARSVQAHVWPLIESGRVKPVVDSVFAMADVAAAHVKMAGSSHIGKILLTP